MDQNPKNLSDSILGEGNSPLIKLKYLEDYLGILNIWSKNEFQNPTGSFKDRESAYVFSELYKRRIKSAAITSSGNAAISACLYANYFGIKLSCYLSSNSCTKKQAILKSLGAELNLVNGYYKDVYEHLVSASDLVNITSGQFIGRETPNANIIFEVFNQLKFLPEVIVTPAGNGSLFYGLYLGIKHLLQTGKIKHSPKLLGIQIENFSPLKNAIYTGIYDSSIGNPPVSVADAGMAAQNSYCSVKVLKAISDIKAEIIVIPEDSILSSHQKFLKSGVLVEYSSAVVLEGIVKYLGNSKLNSALLIMTGSGIKS